MRNFRLLVLAGVALFIAFKTFPARAAEAIPVSHALPQELPFEP
jgi:hypothetical protein